MDSAGPALKFIERFKAVLAPLKLNEVNETNALNLLVDYLHGYAFALNCNANSSLSIEMLEGPLELYCLAIERKSTKLP